MDVFDKQMKIYEDAMDVYYKCKWDNLHPTARSTVAPDTHVYTYDTTPISQPVTFDFALWWSHYGSWILIAALVLIVVVVAIIVNNKTKHKELTDHLN